MHGDHFLSVVAPTTSEQSQQKGKRHRIYDDVNQYATSIENQIDNNNKQALNGMNRFQLPIKKFASFYTVEGQR